MMKFFRKKIAVIALCVPTFFMASCSEEEAQQIIDTIVSIFASMLGYDPETENWEDTDEELDGDDVTTTKKSWEQYCPPVGNQGDRKSVV